MLSACAPNNVSLTPLGRAWAVQGSAIYYNGFNGGVVQDCAGGTNSWQGLAAPTGAADPASIAGSDSAALLLDKDGLLWQRIGITTATPQGSSWSRFTDYRTKAVAVTPASVAWVVHDDGSIHYVTRLQPNGSNISQVVSRDGLSAAKPVAIAANDVGDLLVKLSDGQLFCRIGIGHSTTTGTDWELVASGVASAAVDSARNMWLSMQNGTVLMAPFTNPRIFTVVSPVAAGPRCDHISASMGQPLPPPQSLLLPRPASEKYTGQIISVDLDAFDFSMDASSPGQPDVVAAAFGRYDRILRKTVQHSVPAAGKANLTGVCTGLTVIVHETDTAPRPTAGMDESYELIIGAPTAHLISPSAWGALHGLETFSQLVQLSATGEEHQIATGTITDKPEYSYRGLMVDPARRFLPMAALQAQLDAMSYAKLNVLHIHMTDDQSWPLVIPSMPELATKGAFAPDHTYTLTEIDALVEYARMRGIRCVIEIDMPGHSSILALAKPAVLTSCPGAAAYGLDSETIDPTRNATFDYIRSLFHDVLPHFPDSYLHLGGDEVSTTCWAANAAVKAWLSEHKMAIGDLQSYFEHELVDIARNEMQKDVIVWQEVYNRAADPVLTLGTSAIVDVWKGADYALLKNVTSNGLRAVLSGCWYLDIISGATAWGREWLDYYHCDPRNFEGTDAQKQLVIGGHGALWGEAVDATNFITRAWPRLAAVAERLWTPKNLSSSDVDMGRRMHLHRCRMLARGLAASPVGDLGDPAVPGDLTIGPGSRTYCPSDIEFQYSPP